MSFRAILFPTVGEIVTCWSGPYTLLSVVFFLFLLVGYISRDRLRSFKRDVAPWWDEFDTYFTVVIAGFLLIGYVTFVDSFCQPRLGTAFGEFIRHSGLLALLTAFTAIIALYRLRHRPDKTRPAVREDFENYEGEGPTDFGLRNYGPGPALYLQAVVEVVDDDADDDDDEELVPAFSFEVHEYPIHLPEGEFVSLVPEKQESWVDDWAEYFGIQDAEECDNTGTESAPMVNLYFTFVSRSGTRQPITVTAERDDTRLLESEDLIDREDNPRRIKLQRVVNALTT